MIVIIVLCFCKKIRHKSMHIGCRMGIMYVVGQKQISLLFMHLCLSNNGVICDYTGSLKAANLLFKLAKCYLYILNKS